MGSVNERLRTTMLRTGITTDDLARCCGVDVKTVERWISSDRTPHRSHRWNASRRLGVDETYLWPALLTRSAQRRQQASSSELVELYPDRASVPRQAWLRLMTEAQEHVDVLVFSGTFFSQTQPRIARMLADASARGAQVRLCFGDPGSEVVATRDREERLGDTLAAKIRSSLTYYRPLVGVEGCEVRLHATTLYASLFRYDDEIMVNPHAYGEPASANPTLHLRRLDGGTVADHYISSFERVWETAMPWSGHEI
jgi:transcriptional regulator with XRE-family HTH domain